MTFEGFRPSLHLVLPFLGHRQRVPAQVFRTTVVIRRDAGRLFLPLEAVFRPVPGYLAGF